MIGREKPLREKLFYEGFSLEERVRKDHPLRAIKRAVDFDFIYQEVADEYRYNGNVSVPPSIILKLMFLLFFYDVPSERELIATIPERLDWLWFLGYNLDDKAPDHSVLSKARKRWGKEVFKAFFVRVVRQCVALGLVAGDKLFCDASLVDADVANNHGFKRARWRRLWRVQIQSYLIAAIQNIRIMIKHILKRAKAVVKRESNLLSSSLIFPFGCHSAVTSNFLCQVD
jgi:transposase